MYTFDDKMVAGLNVVLTDEEKAYLTDYYVNLPHLGGWYGQGNQGNIEEIIKNAPDMVLSTGLSQSYIDQANDLQAQMGIPVVIVKDGLDDLAGTYRFLGKLFGREDRGEELAKYTENTITQAKTIAAKIPENKRVRVYYAEEQDGLHTDPAGSTHSQLIELCGGINVAVCDLTPGYGRTAVSIEQVLQWDPELIICCSDNGYADSSSYNTVTTDSKWSSIQAVKNGQVYQTPIQPQNWFDRPPSVNTIIGIKWTLYLLYPDSIDFNIRQEVKDFYELFYHVKLTDKDVDKITDKALRK
jgi:iron complex transport system substrate-binding protein